MRAVVQRVQYSKVTVQSDVTGEIQKGLTVLLGVGNEDSIYDVEYLAEKVVNLRIFEDENGKMNISVRDINGEILVVSQFTLYGDCRKGKRPAYDKAASPQIAEDLYEKFIKSLTDRGITVRTGKFKAHMLVEIHNDGPVTLLLDSKKQF